MIKQWNDFIYLSMEIFTIRPNNLPSAEEDFVPARSSNSFRKHTAIDYLRENG